MPIIEARRIKCEIETVVLGYKCNQCGKEARWEEHNVDHDAAQNFHRFSSGGGYFTTFPGDTDSVEFILCSDCLKGLCENFKVPASYAYGLGSEYAPNRAVLDDALGGGEQVVTFGGGWLVNGDVENIPYEELSDAFWTHPWPDDETHVYRSKVSRCCVETVGFVLHRETNEPHVIYLTLYGDSGRRACRLSAWKERFEPVSLKSMP